MRKFWEYNLAPIKCENKVGDAEVNVWLHKVNDVFFWHKYDYVCPALLTRMKGDLRTALIVCWPVSNNSGIHKK